MKERASIRTLKNHPFITNGIHSSVTSNYSANKSIGFRKRNPKEIKDKIIEMRLLKEGFPNPAQLGKNNKMDS